MIRGITRIAFDLDGTIIDIGDKPRYSIINLLIALSALPSTYITVWSGGGYEYARHWVEKLGLGEYVSDICAKHQPNNIDIAFDDMAEEDVTQLAKVAVLV